MGEKPCGCSQASCRMTSPRLCLPKTLSEFSVPEADRLPSANSSNSINAGSRSKLEERRKSTPANYRFGHRLSNTLGEFSPLGMPKVMWSLARNGPRMTGACGLE